MTHLKGQDGGNTKMSGKAHRGGQTCLVGNFVVRIEAVYCLQGEKAVRELLQSKKILKRLLKTMPKP